MSHYTAIIRYPETGDRYAFGFTVLPEVTNYRGFGTTRTPKRDVIVAENRRALAVIEQIAGLLANSTEPDYCAAVDAALGDGAGDTVLQLPLTGWVIEIQDYRKRYLQTQDFNPGGKHGEGRAQLTCDASLVPGGWFEEVDTIRDLALALG